MPAILAATTPVWLADKASKHATPPPSAFNCSARKPTNSIERRAKRLMTAIVYSNDWKSSSRLCRQAVVSISGPNHVVAMGPVNNTSSHAHRVSFLAIADLHAFAGMSGLFFGRLGDYINCDLCGRLTMQGRWCPQRPACTQATVIPACMVPLRLLTHHVTFSGHRRPRRTRMWAAPAAADLTPYYDTGHMLSVRLVS